MRPLAKSGQLSCSFEILTVLTVRFLIKKLDGGRGGTLHDRMNWGWWGPRILWEFPTASSCLYRLVD